MKCDLVIFYHWFLSALLLLFMSFSFCWALPHYSLQCSIQSVMKILPWRCVPAQLSHSPHASGNGVVSACPWMPMSCNWLCQSPTCHSVRKLSRWWKGHTHNTITLGHWAQPFAQVGFKSWQLCKLLTHPWLCCIRKKTPVVFENITVRDEWAEIKVHITPHCMQKTPLCTLQPGELIGKALRLSV